ncbi:MAG: hypothetical protein ACR2QF_14075 [Geminicoccaceae bacterium]
MYKTFAVVGAIIIGAVAASDIIFRTLSLSLAQSRMGSGSFDLYLLAKIDPSAETVRLGKWSINYASQISEFDEGEISLTYSPTEEIHREIDQDYKDRWLNSPTWSPEACPEAGGFSSYEISAQSNSIGLSDPREQILHIDWFGKETLPVRWITTPERTGTYKVMLTWLHDNKATGCFSPGNLQINGLPAEFEQGHTQIVLEISVLTWAGISITALRWCKVALGLLGFLLTIPFLQPILTARFRQQPHSESG